MAKMESQTKLQKGDKAPKFELPGIDGRGHALAEFADKKGLLIVFMCNHCPYVKARMEEVVALHKEFGNDIAFVGVNASDPAYPGESFAEMKKFAATYGMEFPYLVDANGDIAKAYGATCTPDPFLFDAGHKLVFHGRISDALEPEDTPSEHTMKMNIERLVKGGKIDEWFNPSLGCSIKFKH